MHLRVDTSIPRMKSKFCLEFCFCSRILTRILVFKQNSKIILEHASPSRYLYTQNEIKILLRILFCSRILTRILVFKQNSKRILEHASPSRYLYTQNKIKILLRILFLQQNIDKNFGFQTKF